MVKTKLVIARHGNTFETGDIPRRIGSRTDLALVQSGLEQARRIGSFLRERELIPEYVFSGALKRSLETARLAVEVSGSQCEVVVTPQFNEIDYGPDENQTEDKVKERIGESALIAWNEEGRVPPGWNVDPDQIIHVWSSFAADCLAIREGKVTLVVTSNGIARFAPHILGDFEVFRKRYSIKIATGAIAIFSHDGSAWNIEEWNLRPLN